MPTPAPTGSQGYWREGVSFIEAELQLGLAFSAIALGARNWETTVRNTAHAQAAFNVARRSVDRIRLTPKDQRDIDRGFEKLTENLMQLSEFLGGSAA